MTGLTGRGGFLWTADEPAKPCGLRGWRHLVLEKAQDAGDVVVVDVCHDQQLQAALISPQEVRWSARRKADAVMRLLRGEDLDEVSRELRVEAHRLAAWRDEFMAGGLEGLKARPLQPEERRLKEAERKIGELTMENEVLNAVARKRGLQIPPRRRPR
jgi:transposase